MKQIFIPALIALSFVTASAQAATGALFANGASETFKLQDKNGKTPEFRILDGGGSEQALALGVIATLNAQAEVQPKLPMQNHVDLKLQSLKFEPLSKTSKELAMMIKLSGYEIEFKETVNRAKFESGANIEINFPQKEKQLAMFNVESSGKLKMKFDPKTQTLLLSDVQAKMKYESPLGDNGQETIQFTGKGIRQ